MHHASFNRDQQELRFALGDILDAYAVVGRDPSDQAIDAFALLFNCSPNEFRR